MPDTIKCYKPLFQIGETKEQITERLKPLTRQWFVDKKGRTVLIGDKELHFRFIVTNTMVYFSGSICKFYYGDNLHKMRRLDLLKAIIRLRKLTKLPVQTFYVSRIDFAENIVLDESTSNYIKMLEEVGKYKRQEHRVLGKFTGLYFVQSKNQILIYDKFKEQQHRTKQNRNGRKGIINRDQTNFTPVWSQYFDENGRNVLRFELRLIKSVPAHFGVSEVLLRDFARRSFWKQIVRLWFLHMLKLKWRKTITRIHPALIQGKALKDLILRAGIEYLGGENAVLKMIENASKNKQFENANQPYRMKQMVKKISKGIDIEVYKNEVLYFELRRKWLNAALEQLGIQPVYFKVRQKH